MGASGEMPLALAKAVSQCSGCPAHHMAQACHRDVYQACAATTAPIASKAAASDLAVYQQSLATKATRLLRRGSVAFYATKA